MRWRLVAWILLVCLSLACEPFRFDCSFRGDTLSQMKALRQALDIFQVEYGMFPDRLAALVDAGIVRELPRDEWGHPFLYGYDGVYVSLVSCAADGEPGGFGDAEDLMLRWRSANIEPACIADWRRALTRYGARHHSTPSESNACHKGLKPFPGVKQTGPRRFLVDTRAARNFLDVLHHSNEHVLGRVRKTKIAERDGPQIYDMPCTSPYRALGLLNEDLVACVNGRDLNPDRALQIIEELRHGRVSRYQVAIVRSGKLIYFVYELMF